MAGAGTAHARHGRDMTRRRAGAEDDGAGEECCDREGEQPEIHGRPLHSARRTDERGDCGGGHAAIIAGLAADPAENVDDRLTGFYKDLLGLAIR